MSDNISTFICDLVKPFKLNPNEELELKKVLARKLASRLKILSVECDSNESEIEHMKRPHDITKYPEDLKDAQNNSFTNDDRSLVQVKQRKPDFDLTIVNKFVPTDLELKAEKNEGSPKQTDECKRLSLSKNENSLPSEFETVENIQNNIFSTISGYFGDLFQCDSKNDHKEISVGSDYLTQMLLKSILPNNLNSSLNIIKSSKEEEPAKVPQLCNKSTSTADFKSRTDENRNCSSQNNCNEGHQTKSTGQRIANSDMGRMSGTNQSARSSKDLSCGSKNSGKKDSGKSEECVACGGEINSKNRDQYKKYLEKMGKTGAESKTLCKDCKSKNGEKTDAHKKYIKIHISKSGNNKTCRKKKLFPYQAYLAALGRGLPSIERNTQFSGTKNYPMGNYLGGTQLSGTERAGAGGDSKNNVPANIAINFYNKPGLSDSSPARLQSPFPQSFSSGPPCASWGVQQQPCAMHCPPVSLCPAARERPRFRRPLPPPPPPIRRYQPPRPAPVSQRQNISSKQMLDRKYKKFITIQPNSELRISSPR